MKFRFNNHILRDEETGAPPAGGTGATATAMTESEFRGAVLNQVDKAVTQMTDLTTKYGNLDKTTKDAFEELTKIKNGYTGLSADVKGIENAFAKVRLQLNHELRLANGDPIKRIMADHDKIRGFLHQVARVINADARALGEDSSPGSTVIDDALAAEVYDALLMYGAWSSLGVRNVGTKTTKFPVKTVRPIANFILTEGGAIADDTNKAGTSVSIDVEVIAVLLNVSMQLLQDGEIDVAADVISDFIEALNFRMDFAAFVGDGTANATHGGVTGLFTFGTDVSAIATHTTIAATTYTDWLKCLTGIAPVVLQRAARWWIHPTLMAAAIGVKDGNGRPIFQTATEAPLGGVGSIFGYPVTLVGAAPATDAAASNIAAFGDPQAYVVAVRRGFEVDTSDHATWTTYSRSFRGVGRFGAKGRVATAITVLNTAAS